MHKIAATCFFIASKYDELDDRIPRLKDIQRFLNRTLDCKLTVASWEEFIECERMLVKYYGWDLMVLIPLHFIRGFLANGVIFETIPKE